MSTYARTHSDSPSGSYFHLDPFPLHGDELTRQSHHQRLTRSITNSSFRSVRTFAGYGGAGQGISEDQYRVLLELQRLLYHGPGETTFLEEDGADEESREGRKEQLKAFVHEYLESDCLYESPLITLQSRPLLLDALALSTDLARGSLPSLWPRAIVSHVKGALSWSLGKVFTIGTGREPAKDPEKGDAEGHPQALRDLLRGFVVPLVDRAEKGDAWWDAWQVGSECSEIGGFETYEGYHLGVIDHTMTLDLLPAMLPPTSTEFSGPHHVPSSTSVFTSPSASLSHGHNLPVLIAALQTKTQPPAPPTSLPYAALQTWLASVLRYRLRVRTFVEFNEAGKVSYIRDVVDLRDAWEAVVPFGRAASWVGRRVGGVLLAGVGGIVSSPSTSTPKSAAGKGKKKGLYASHLALQDQLGRRDVHMGIGTDYVGKGTSLNALGLQEAWVPRPSTVPAPREVLVAPDVDQGGETSDHHA